MNDQFLKDLITNDQIGSPDEEINERLNRAFLTKSANYRTKQNSFADFANWLFSWNGMAVKTTLAAFFIALFLINPKIYIPSGSSIQIDSARVTQSIQIDSAVFKVNSQTTKDSI